MRIYSKMCTLSEPATCLNTSDAEQAFGSNGRKIP